MKNVTQLINSHYQKNKKINDLAEWIQNSENGVTIDEIAEKLGVCRRTATSLKHTLKQKYPQLKEVSKSGNLIRWIIPKDTVSQYPDSIKNPISLMPPKKTSSYSLFSLPKDDCMIDNLIKLNKEKTLNDKLKMLIVLGKKAGYDKLTDKQIMIAYYGKYTTQDKTDRKTLSEIREGLNCLQTPYMESIDKDG